MYLQLVIGFCGLKDTKLSCNPLHPPLKERKVTPYHILDVKLPSLITSRKGLIGAGKPMSDCPEQVNFAFENSLVSLNEHVSLINDKFKTEATVAGI